MIDLFAFKSVLLRLVLRKCVYPRSRKVACPQSHNRRPWLAVAAAMFAFCFMAEPVMATCTGSVGGGRISGYVYPPATLLVSPNAAVGSVLWDSGWVATPLAGNVWTCAATDSVYMGYQAAKTLATGYGKDVYSVAVPGIGVMSGVVFGSTPPAAGTFPAGSILQSAAPFIGTFGSLFGGGTTFGPAFMYTRVVFLVTDATISSGTVSFGLAVGGYFFGSVGSVVGSIQMGSKPLIATSTCSVVTNPIAVAMPDVHKADFGAIGDAAGTKSFNISLNCPTGMSKVGLDFMDSTTPGNTSTVLTLAPGSTGGGLGYKIQYNSADVAYAAVTPATTGFVSTQNRINLGSVPSGVTNLPFTASYVRTGALQPGTINAQAIFTISYQ